MHFQGSRIGLWRGEKTNNNANLLRILSIKSAGTVFWNYPGDQYLSIPLNHSLTF